MASTPNNRPAPAFAHDQPLSAASVSGWTESTNFPTTPGAYDTDLSGGCDAFVVRLNTSGSVLDYGTFLGGSNLDYGYALALDAAGGTTVTGRTGSSDFPTTTGAFDTSFNGYYDAFVVRLSATGHTLDYGTFVGGSYRDLGGYALTVDATGRATVTGQTESSDFPTTPGAFDTSYNYGVGDAFVIRLNVTGSALEYSTYLGGGGSEYGYAQALDVAGRVTVSGWTGSSDFPTTSGAFDTSFNGGISDVFVARLNTAGSVLEYGTFLGGSNRDLGGYALALDAAGRAITTGRTESTDFPVTPGVFEPSYSYGDGDAFVSKLNLAPPPSPTFTWHSEAEVGILGGIMHIESDPGASACQYVSSTGAGSNDAVTFNLNLPYNDEYYLWARAKGIDWTHNSFWVRVDGGEDVHFEIQPVNNSWVFGWQPISSMVLPQQPFALPAGTHTVRFQAREPLAQLDAVLLVNRADVVPTQFTPCGVTPTLTPTPTNTSTAIPTNTPTPTTTPTPTPTNTPSPTPTATVVPPPVYLPLIWR